MANYNLQRHPSVSHPANHCSDGSIGRKLMVVWQCVAQVTILLVHFVRNFLNWRCVYFVWPLEYLI